MSQVQTGVLAHDQAVNKSEGQVQAALIGMPAQAAVNAAYIAHYRTCLASALANKCGVSTFLAALRSLGVNG